MTSDLLDILQNNAIQHPEKLALVFEGERWSYREFHTRVARLASGFRELGIRKGDHVSVAFYAGNALVATIYALQWIGAVPIYASYSLLSDLPGVLDDTDSVGLVYGSEAREALAGMPADRRPNILVSADADDGMGVSLADLGRSAPMAPLPRTPDQHSGVIFSAGTTGRPKAILRTYSTDLWDAIQKALIYRLGYEDVWIYISPKNLTAFVGPTRPMLLTGSSYVVIDGFDPGKVARVCADERVTQLTLLSPQWAEFLDLPDLGKYDLSALRQVTVSASQMPTDLKRRLTDQFGALPALQVYGMSESGMVSCAQEGDSKGSLPSSVGRPLATLQVRILESAKPGSRELNDMPIGEPGEIAVKGPGTSPGYYKRAEATAASFIDGWVRTGDLGRLDEDGALYLIDRLSDVLTIDGRPVYPGIVQDALFSLPGVNEAAIVLAHRNGAAVPVVSIVPKRDTMTDPGAVAGSLRQLLALPADYPVEIRLTENLPRTPAGKVDRRALTRLAAEG